jgi:hypothetical protein
VAKALKMRWDNLSGRRERRLPIAVVVRLEVLARERVIECEREYEKTYTDNLSAHGVRVKSTHPWHPGEQAEIAPLGEKSPVRAEVVYCQRLDDKRFFIGLKFPKGKVPWAALKRFDGI